MKFTKSILAAAIAVAATVSSGNAQYAGYTLWSDQQFNGSYDASKWEKGCGTFGENATRFKASNVYVENGMLKMRIKKEYTHTGPWGCENAHLARSYSGGEFRMINRPFAFGMAQCRMKTPGNGGYIASMFTYDYGPSRTRTDSWNEIDFEWEGSHLEKVSTNLLEGNCGKQWECTQWCYCACSKLITPFKGFRHTAWHTYRLEFTPTYIKWYCDGVNFRTIDGNYIYRNPNGADIRYAAESNGCINGWRNGYIPQRATRVMFNMWVAQHGQVANALGGEWNDWQMPKIAVYDWIKIYKRN